MLLVTSMSNVVIHSDTAARGATLGRSASDSVAATTFSRHALDAGFGCEDTRWWLRPIRDMFSVAVPRCVMAWNGRPEGSAIALTIDDGPDPLHTPRLLEILSTYGVHATFFLVGERAEQYPELVARIVAGGHEIGNHSYSHAHFGHLTLNAARTELVVARRILEALQGGQSCRLFRPPYGTVCAASTLVPWVEGNTVVLWNVDFKDFRATEPADILDRLAARRLTAGDIVLYHGQNPAALAALPGVIESAHRSRLVFAPVSRLCA